MNTATVQQGPTASKFQLSPRNMSDVIKNLGPNYRYPHEFSNEKIAAFEELLRDKMTASQTSSQIYLVNKKTKDTAQITSGWINESENEFIFSLSNFSVQIKFGFEDQICKRRWVIIRTNYPHILAFLKSILLQ